VSSILAVPDQCSVLSSLENPAWLSLATLNSKPPSTDRILTQRDSKLADCRRLLRAGVEPAADATIYASHHLSLRRRCGVLQCGGEDGVGYSRILRDYSQKTASTWHIFRSFQICGPPPPGFWHLAPTRIVAGNNSLVNVDFAVRAVAFLAG